MAYVNGKTYYLIPEGAVINRANVLSKVEKPVALNLQGSTNIIENNRNVNVWTIDYSTDMQWVVNVPYGAGFARLLCRGNIAFGLDYYYGVNNPGNCDIYNISNNQEDSKINFRTVSAGENRYRIQCYRNDTDNDLYLTATGFTNGADVRWEKLDSSKAAYQTWWLVPVENVVANGGSESPDTPESSVVGWNLINPPSNISNVDIMATYNAALTFADGSCFVLNDVPDCDERFAPTYLEDNCKMHKGSGFKSNVANFQSEYSDLISVIRRAVNVMYGRNDFEDKQICHFLFGEYDSGVGIHHGIDLAIEENSTIKALISGEVVSVDEPNGKVVILNEDGETVSCYYHMNTITVKKGDSVIGGETPIGTEGRKGNVTGPHLHFEIRTADKTVGAAPEQYDFNTKLTSIIPYGFMKKAVEIYDNRNS